MFCSTKSMKKTLSAITEAAAGFILKQEKKKPSELTTHMLNPMKQAPLKRRWKASSRSG